MHIYPIRPAIKQPLRFSATDSQPGPVFRVLFDSHPMAPKPVQTPFPPKAPEPPPPPKAPEPPPPPVATNYDQAKPGRKKNKDPEPDIHPDLPNRSGLIRQRRERAARLLAMLPPNYKLKFRYPGQEKNEPAITLSQPSPLGYNNKREMKIARKDNAGFDKLLDALEKGLQVMTTLPERVVSFSTGTSGPDKALHIYSAVIALPGDPNCTIPVNNSQKHPPDTLLHRIRKAHALIEALPPEVVFLSIPIAYPDEPLIKGTVDLKQQDGAARTFETESRTLLGFLREAGDIARKHRQASTAS